jgi:peptidylamidoglycolate lyase
LVIRTEFASHALAAALVSLTGAVPRAQAPPRGPADGHPPVQHLSVPCVARPAGRRGTKLDCYPHTLSRGRDLGYTVDNNPLRLPAGLEFASHVSSVAINSKGHIFVFHRARPGQPQLLEFDEHEKFVRGFGADIAVRAHGMTIDPQDNIWICDQKGATVTKLAPGGEPLMVIGVKGQPGDWDEARGKRVLWEPLSVAIASGGDFYIAMGHANESPAGPPARVLHLDKTGAYIHQWFGDAWGPGKFSMIHQIAIDNAGNVYLADREEYRLVIFDGAGHYIKTIHKTNLVGGILIAKNNDFWVSLAADGQIEKLAFSGDVRDFEGTILGTVGTGPGDGIGQFGEAADMAMDSGGAIYVADGVDGRVEKLTPPHAKN